MKALTPKIDKVSDWASWGNRRDILYKCPECHTSFRVLGKQEKFCHNCGQMINWQFVPDFIDTTNIKGFKEMTEDEIEHLIEEYIVEMRQYDRNIIEES